jgi:hypothetical protein
MKRINRRGRRERGGKTGGNVSDRSLWFSLCALCALCGESSSAPPSLTSLDPPGAARGKTVGVTAAGTFDAWPVRVWCSDPAVTGTAGPAKGSLTLSVGPDATPGTCWLRLFDDAGASQLRPFVVGVLPDVAEAEPNDLPTKPQAVALPAVVNGKLAKNGDVDCFAVKLARGQTLVASVQAHEALRSPIDGVLQLLSPAGAVLDQNHDHRGLDPQIAYTAPDAGIYVVRLFAFPAQPDSSIRHYGSADAVYRLTLTTGGFVESFAPLAVERGRDAVLTLRGWNLADPTHRLPAGADRFVAAGAAKGGTVRREPHPCPDPTGDPLAPPFTVTGRVVRMGEPTVITIKTAKGDRLTVRAEAPGPSPLRPVVRVVAADGKPLVTAEPSGTAADCEATLTAPAAGAYRVEVRDLFRRGGPDYDFFLRVAAPAPDFVPTVASDRMTVVAGTPLDLPVTLGAKNGFAGDLDWDIDGLPDDVSAGPHGDPTREKVVLRFAADEHGFNGPVRITARSANATRPVTSKLVDFDDTTADLWLTVVPAKK